jgi:pimeloyl-ACP methyl ester carboxylesterase
MHQLKSYVLLTIVLTMFNAFACLAESSAKNCGEIITLTSHDQTTTRYALGMPQKTVHEARTGLVLLVGGSGNPDLDDTGCPHNLVGNSLIRMLPLFHEAGFITALVDAPSDYATGDGLAGFRISTEHADDLGKVIADLRNRTKGPVWVIGTSRGTISAVNVAARLKGPNAPDGVVLTSALMIGDTMARKRWVGQTVFDLPLELIKVPVLIVGHASDSCLRSPADQMPRIAKRLTETRQQIVTVTGGKGATSSGLEACEGRSPHGFIGQETELARGIARFIRDGAY